MQNLKSVWVLFAVLSALSAQASTVETIYIFSKSMEKNIPVTLILPDAYTATAHRFPVVYLLHGAGDSNSKWHEATEVSNLSDTYSIIFVCPDADKTSWYFDSPINPKSQYETFVAKECVEHIDQNYRTKANRTYRALCGNSMGGHGSMYLAIRHPDVFSIAVPLSGGVDIRPYPNKWGIKQRIGSISKEWDKYTVIILAKDLKDGELAISIDCGDQDFFLGVNRALHAQLTEAGITHEYVEKTGGHTWAYWNEAIKRQMPFIVRNFQRTTIAAPNEEMQASIDRRPM
jgi:S-formylglutathione hydrolase FrmB